MNWFTFKSAPQLSERNLKLMKNFSSSGPDGITFVILKGGGQFLLSILVILFQKCLDAACVPTEWKTGFITPIFKKGNRKEPGNYRPVSLTSCVCKLMKSYIRDEIWRFWMERNIIQTTQYEIIPGSSCPPKLQCLDDVTSSVDCGKLVDVVYLNFKKVFNSVPHERLICKPSARGIEEKLLKFFKDLNERSNLLTANTLTMYMLQISMYLLTVLQCVHYLCNTQN